ncbi:MAG: M20/M25/M40 family metallo-hydrolase [Phycisphaerae bacterium]|nr:M20/M25/M40 family metallo-hydrolase [Phycisphaerae bacterium]
MTPLLLAISLFAADPIDEAVARVSAQRCRDTVDRLVSFGTRHTLSDRATPSRGVLAAANWIKSELDAAAAESAGRMTVAIEEFTVPPGTVRMPTGGTITNVLATLQGSAPDAKDRRYYLVGHFDSMCGDVMNPDCDAPGANDNASGTTVVIEAARALAALQPESTIVFLCTSGEEQGLLGAKLHADKARADGVRIMGVLNNDIVGDPWGQLHPLLTGKPAPAEMGSYVRVFSEALPRNPSAEQLAQIRSLAREMDSPSRQLARFIDEVGSRHNLTIKPKLVFRLDRFLRGGDHTSFLEAGYPAVRFSSPNEDYSRQHQNVREVEVNGRSIRMGDLPEFVDADYLAGVTRLNVAAVLALADAPSPPSNVRLITARLAPDATLRWEPAPESDTAGYEVVWRDTTAAVWTNTRDAGNAHTLTLPLSKDDFFFGVRSYDRDGHRSPVVFAAAARD